MTNKLVIYGEKIRHVVLVIFLALLCQACVPEHLTDYDYKALQPPSTLEPEKGLVLIGDKQLNGVKVELYIYNGAHTGFNQVQIKLIDVDSGLEFSESTVQLDPQFILDNEEWDVVFENPADRTNEEGFFVGSLLLNPPEAMAGEFSLNIYFETPDSREGTVSFELNVEESIWMQRVQTGDALFFVSWVKPTRPIVGSNVFEIDIRKLSGNGYEAYNAASVDLYPYMDMGGGEGHSTPFESPVFIQEARYAGEVDFIMAGGWEMTVYLQLDQVEQHVVKYENFYVY